MDRRLIAIAIVGVALVGGPRSASADLLIANVGSNSILRYNEAANTLSTFSSGDNGALVVPHGMTYGPDGNLYVSSLGTGSILEYNGQTGAFLGTFVSHQVGNQTLEYPNGIAFDPQNPHALYIASYYDNAIERYDTIAHTLTVYATLPSTDATAILKQGPTGLVFGPDGNLYVNNSSSYDGSQIRQYNVANGDTVGRSIVLGSTDSATHLSAPAQLAFGPSNGTTPPLLINTNFYQSTVNTFQITGQGGSSLATFQHELANGPTNGLNQPGGVVYDPSTGRVVIANYLGNSLISAALDGTADVTTMTPISQGGAVLDHPTYVVATPASGHVNPTPAPEPAAWAMFGIGALILAGSRFARRKSRRPQ